MNPITQFRRWVAEKIFDGYFAEHHDELHELAGDIANLQHDASDQDDRLSQVEVRVGIRSAERWKQQRDAS